MTQFKTVYTALWVIIYIFTLQPFPYILNVPSLFLIYSYFHGEFSDKQHSFVQRVLTFTAKRRRIGANHPLTFHISIRTGFAQKPRLSETDSREDASTITTIRISLTLGSALIYPIHCHHMHHLLLTVCTPLKQTHWGLLNGSWMLYFGCNNVISARLSLKIGINYFLSEQNLISSTSYFFLGNRNQVPYHWEEIIWPSIMIIILQQKPILTAFSSPGTFSSPHQYLFLNQFFFFNKENLNHQVSPRLMEFIWYSTSLFKQKESESTSFSSHVTVSAESSRFIVIFLEVS